MPHFTLEYTANLTAHTDIPTLLKKVNQVLMAQNGLFPSGGIRSRAICHQEYCIAEGLHDDAFAHAVLKVGAGRPREALKKVGDEVFEVIKAHFADLFGQRYLALSLELSEFSEAGSYKHNNLHSRYQKGK
jgi:5-carboxymethyl-2-hydroxymuconate isomerase